MYPKQSLSNVIHPRVATLSYTLGWQNETFQCTLYCQDIIFYHSFHIATDFLSILGFYAEEVGTGSCGHVCVHDYNKYARNVIILAMFT